MAPFAFVTIIKKTSYADCRQLRERLQLAINPKHYPIRSFFVFCKRHLGPLWILRFALPYLVAIAPRLF